MDEHAHGFAGGVLGIEPEQRGQQVRAVRQARRLLVDHFDLVALQYGDIHELLGFVAAAVLDNQQTGSDHLKHEARRRQVARGAPDEELLTVAPDAEVNAGTLHGGRKPRERLRRKRQPPLELQGPLHCFRRNEGERDARHVAFLAPQAGPESRFDDCLNRAVSGTGQLLRPAEAGPRRDVARNERGFGRRPPSPPGMRAGSSGWLPGGSEELVRCFGSHGYLESGDKMGKDVMRRRVAP